VRALEQLGAGYASADGELRHHMRRLGAWIAARLEAYHGSAELPRRLDLPPALAALLAERAAPVVPRPGVEAILLDADRTWDGFLVRVVVTEGDAAAGGRQRRLPRDAGPALAEAVRRAEQAVARELFASGRVRPDAALLTRYRLELEGPPRLRACGADGGSIGAAAAVALYACWTGRPLPPGIAITGALSADLSAVQAVEGLEAKVECALRERPGLAQVIVPQEGGHDFDDPRVIVLGDLPALLTAVFGPDALAAEPRPAAVDVEGTVRAGLELYEKAGAFGAAYEVLGAARRAIAARRGADRGVLHRVEEFHCLWRQGACLIHRGDPFGARELLQQARALGDELWDAGELDPRAHFGCRGNHAVLLRDLFDYAGAEALLEQTLAQQRALRQDKRELAKTLGNLGELWTFAGDVERAEQALEQALESLEAVYPDEVPRELCYLGNLHLRRGDAERAEACYQRGLRANEGVTYGQARNEVFLRYGLARVALARARPARGRLEVAQAQALLADELEPYPRQFLQRVDGLCLLELGREAEGIARLERAADATHVHGPLAQLGVSLARAELARHRLRAGELEDAWRAARTFVEAAGPLLDSMCGADYRGALQVLLESGPGEERRSALDAALALAVERFPY
jgi:tetratricopeptide (TPR) repeat protein